MAAVRESSTPTAVTLNTACPLDCPDTCSLTATVDDGRLVGVDAGDGNPLTDGFICQKVKHHARRVYAPERVLTPLVRTGPKGAGEFRPASWDEALDLVAERMRDAAARFGAESVVPYVYNSSAPAMQSLVTDRFFGRFGASRVDDTICAATHGKAWEEMFGNMLSADPRDVVHARLIVVWGANPTVSNVHFPPLVNRARRAGARLVVVDPRRTAMARRADRHLAPRPGTDVVLALAMAAHLERAGLVDRAFLEQHTQGAEEFLDAARPWTPEVAEAICGVPAAGDHRRGRGAGRVPARVLPRRLGTRAQPQRRLRLRRRVRACRCSRASSASWARASSRA